MEHELIIFSLHHCDVACSCGRWFYWLPDPVSLETVCDKHQEHVNREKQKEGGFKK